MSLRVALVIAGLSQVSVAESSCLVGAYVDSPIVQAKFLLFDQFVNYRARFGDRAYLSEGLQCLEGGRNYKPGINFAVLDTSNGTQCSSTSPIFPQSYPQSFSTRRERCNPVAYERDPWACVPGDWSGKFGPMDLGLSPIVSKMFESQRFLEQGDRSLRDSMMSTKEEVSSNRDPMAIPTCLLDGKTVGIFCADGRVAGCAELRVLARGYDKELMEEGFRFFVPIPSTRSNTIPTQTPQSDRQEDRSGWRDTISKEVGKVPDYVSGWWEDVKRKSTDAWSSRQNY